MSHFSPTPDVTALDHWLCEQGLLRVSLETLLEGFCERLAAIGVALTRG